MRSTTITAAVVVAAVAILTARPTGPEPDLANYAARGEGDAARLQIPASIQREHKELHEQLALASKAGGETGKASEKVARLLHPHFVKEETYALPPLGMLRAFADGEVPADAEQVLALTEQFRAEYPRMLEEHEAIVAALDELIVTARAEKHPEVAEFATALMRHAEAEEEILYPTTVLIGEYLKLLTANDAPGDGTRPQSRQK